MHVANSSAIDVVLTYCTRLERQKIPYWRSEEFAQLSYSKTAAYSILSALKIDETTPPLQIIEDFRDRMNELACLNPKTSIMFSVAHDTAEDIIDEIIKSYYN